MSDTTRNSARDTIRFPHNTPAPSWSQVAAMRERLGQSDPGLPQHIDGAALCAAYADRKHAPVTADPAQLRALPTMASDRCIPALQRTATREGWYDAIDWTLPVAALKRACKRAQRELRAHDALLSQTVSARPAAFDLEPWRKL